MSEKMEFDFSKILASKAKVEKHKKEKMYSSDEKGESLNFTIVDEDSPLVIIIKKMIKDKKTTRKDLLPKVENAMELNNLIRSLRINSSMSYNRFCRWMELLDGEFTLTISYNNYEGKEKKIYNKDNVVRVVKIKKIKME